jgi:DNA mismatch endonuclease (patch repair protein)
MPSGVYEKSEKHRKNLSLSLSGKKNPMFGKLPARKGKTNIDYYGVEKAEEIKKRNSLAHVDKCFSEKARQNMSLSHKGKPSGMKDKHQTENAKELIRLAFLGKSNPNFGKHFISKLKGKTFEELYGIEKAIIIKNNMKKPKSKEHIQKIKDWRVKFVFPLKDTSIEIALQNILRDNNIIFEKHKPIHGQPDLFIEPNICVFADGDYWHNYPIGRDRDREVTQKLTDKGYKVLRFWERDILNDIESCFALIRKEMNEEAKRNEKDVSIDRCTAGVI